MDRLIVFTTALFVVLALADPGFAQVSAERDYWSHGWGYGHMMFGGFTMIIFWGAVILLVVLLARCVVATSTPNNTDESNYLWYGVRICEQTS